MIRRWILAVLCLAMALPTLAQEQKETVITVWGMAITPDEKGADVLVRQFERENPGIKVRLLGMGAGAMSPQKLMTAIVGGSPPDLVRQDRFTMSDWASRGAFRSLDDLMARDQGTDPRTPRQDQYYPATWQETVYDGKVYGIPIGADDRVLYWNYKLFEANADKLRAAGLDPTRPPRTWSETLEYSKVLTEFNPDGTIKRAGFIPNYGNSWLYMYAFQNNANFMSADGRTCTLSSPEVQESLQFMVDGYALLGGLDNANKFQSGFQSGENDPFATGKVAMLINGDWEIARYSRTAPNAKFKTAPAPVPDDRYNKRGRFASEEDTFVTWSGGFGWSMPKGAKNVEAAWKFLKWITCLEGRQVNINAQADMDRARGRRYIPRMEAHIEANDWIIDRFASGDSQYEQALAMHAEMMPFAEMRPATFVAQKLWDEHVRAAEEASRGSATPAAALKESEKRVQVLLDEFYEKEKHPAVNVGLILSIAIGLTVVGLALWVRWMIRQGTGRVSKQETKAGYLFISPWVIGFLIFTLGPMIASMVYSFLYYDVLNEARWAGLSNYHDVFVTDRPFVLKTFANVAYLAGIGIPLGLMTGLGIALMLNVAAKGIRFYRTAYYLPAVTPIVASTFVWMWLLTPDNQRGLINNIWSNTIQKWFEIAPPGWFGVEAWAKPSLIMMGLWGAGSGMILWLAGLKGVPKTLYEAAGIDGASPTQQFFKITLPQLTPLIFFNSVMAFIGVLQTFDNVFIVTQGTSTGPSDSLAFPVYHLFTNGFAYFRMGYASALAWVIFAIVVIITFVQFKLAPKWVHTEVDR
ncbi:MAG: extracellular solute-binding protein [Armatimonadetes bacterium]|nr:extracellular solute-binding protein [Armatimonadota bacterium]